MKIKVAACTWFRLRRPNAARRLVVAFAVLCMPSFVPILIACRPATSTDRTRWETTEIGEKQTRTVRRIEGTVTFGGGEQGADVLVEVFPSAALRTNADRNIKRIAACLTDTAGRFSFPGIGDGMYEVRFSKVHLETRRLRVDVKRTATDQQIEVMLFPPI